MNEKDREIAFEAYRQACHDLDPMISEQTITTYFDNWWSRRNEKRQLGTWDHYWDVG